METLAGWKGGRDRPDQKPDSADKNQTGFEKVNCQCLECGRCGRYGFAPLSFVVSVLCSGRKAVLSAISEKRRCVFGRAVQYCFIRPLHHDDGSSMWPRTW